MKTSIQINKNTYNFNINKPLRISNTLKNENNLTAWYVDQPKIEAVEGDGFVGDVSKGGSVNFRNIFFNPHGHTTHTECVGHISKDQNVFITNTFKKYFFKCILVSVLPTTENVEDVLHWQKGDKVITKELVKNAINQQDLIDVEVVVLRTLPNSDEKTNLNYSGTNPTYLHPEVMTYLKELGVMHFIIDQPSVDREEDGGLLQAHKVWWDYPENTNLERTITELAFIPNSIEDGNYIIDFQLMNIQNDAAPSNPILYKIEL